MFKMCQVCLYITNELSGEKNFRGHQTVHLNEGNCLSQSPTGKKEIFTLSALKKTPTQGEHY